MLRPMLVLLVVASLVACSPSTPPPPPAYTPAVSGITHYEFDPAPQDVSPKMHNWIVVLDKAVSAGGAYEIVQETAPLSAEGELGPVVSEVLIEAKWIAVNAKGLIHFRLHVGNAEPTANMLAPGNAGHPVVFSGIGTGKGASSWVVLPGGEFERVTPTTTESALVGGACTFIRYLVKNGAGERFQADVVLRRKGSTNRSTKSVP